MVHVDNLMIASTLERCDLWYMYIFLKMAGKTKIKKKVLVTPVFEPLGRFFLLPVVVCNRRGTGLIWIMWR